MTSAPHFLGPPAPRFASAPATANSSTPSIVVSEAGRGGRRCEPFFQPHAEGGTRREGGQPLLQPQAQGGSRREIPHGREFFTRELSLPTRVPAATLPLVRLRQHVPRNHCEARTVARSSTCKTLRRCPSREVNLPHLNELQRQRGVAANLPGRVLDFILKCEGMTREVRGVVPTAADRCDVGEQMKAPRQPLGVAVLMKRCLRVKDQVDGRSRVTQSQEPSRRCRTAPLPIHSCDEAVRGNRRPARHRLPSC